MPRDRQLPSTTLADWLTRIEIHDERPDRRVHEAAGDVVDALSACPAGVPGALYRFGNVLGTDGWPIAMVCAWLHLLDELVDRRRRRLLARCSTHVALAQGWADGSVRGAHTGMCIDPTTGLVTPTVLRLRLREVYEQSSASGVLPADLYTLVVIDVDRSGLPRLEADLLMACVADAVHALFRQGETIARADGRIVVLAGNTEPTQQRAAILADRLRLTPSTQRARATIALDPLPSSASMLERYVRDLVG